MSRTCFPVGLIWGMNPYVKPLVILKLTSGSVHKFWDKQGVGSFCENISRNNSNIIIKETKHSVKLNNLLNKLLYNKSINSRHYWI